MNWRNSEKEKIDIDQDGAWNQKRKANINKGSCLDKIREYSISGNKTSSDVFDTNFYAFIINSLPVAVLTVDADLNITRFNPWTEEITGYQEEEAIGHHCGEILKGGICGQRAG